MEFRLAQSADLDQLARLRWQLWVEDGQDPAQLEQAKFSHEFATWLEQRLSSDWFVWCAIEGEVIVSHIYIQRIQKLPKPSAPLDAFGYVTSVFTQPDYRNKGIGSELLGFVKSWALASNLEFLVLWPSEKSVPFWHRADFSHNESLLSEA